MTARRPIATSTMSASMVSGAPPLAFSTVTTAPASLVSTPVTLWPSLKRRPCLDSTRSKVLATSPSMPGTSRSRYSITVTSAPSRCHTLPSSSPITPPPITTSRPGTRSSSSAPVELTMRFSSISMPGSDTLSLPVAMTTCLARKSLAPPSPVTATVFGAVIRPAPFSQVTPFFLNRNSTPLVLAATTSFLRACMRARSSVTSPTITPCAAMPSLASWKLSELCSSAFDGMQPILRQVPPSVARFSTQATFSPSWAARSAHT